jgi:HEAT repeat protein
MTGNEVSAMSVDDIVAKALNEGADGGTYWGYVSHLQKLGTRAVFERAAALCSATGAPSRRLGLDILAQLGYEVGRPFVEQALPIAIELASDPELSVRVSAISALGKQWDVRALPTVLEHRLDADPDVRLAVAQAVPSVVSDPPEADAVASLLELMRDSACDVRDWATLGIGTLLEDVDGDDIRQALTERLDDPDGDTAGEALVGLARRRDPGIIERVRGLLAEPNVGNLTVEAAGELADPRLLPALERLRTTGWSQRDPRGRLLEPAIAACRSGKPAEQ